MFVAMSGVGAHEVIVETPDHRDTADTADGQIVDVLKTYRERMQDLGGDDRFKYVPDLQEPRRLPGRRR